MKRTILNRTLFLLLCISMTIVGMSCEKEDLNIGASSHYQEPKPINPIVQPEEADDEPLPPLPDHIINQ